MYERLRPYIKDLQARGLNLEGELITPLTLEANHTYHVSSFSNDYETTISLPQGSTKDQIVKAVRGQVCEMPGLEEWDTVYMNMTTGEEVD
jgi:hypothetical protein